MSRSGGKVNPITGLFYNVSMLSFMGAIGFGATFIATSMSSRFFRWTIDSCDIKGRMVGGNTSSVNVDYNVDMKADIGWREFTVTYIDEGAAGCFTDLSQGSVYPISAHQDNSGSAAGFGMVAAWAGALLAALITFVTMARARGGTYRGGFSLTGLSKWCTFFTVGIAMATTVFWWMIEGKFGDREEALAPRLLASVAAAADLCREGSNLEDNPCRKSEWEIESPGWSLSLGITAMVLYAVATCLLSMRAPRTDALLNGEQEPELDVVKHAVGADFVVDKSAVGDDKTRAKDRRSAKTGVRSGGRAPSSTVAGGAEHTGPDPMTYALEDGGDEEVGSQEDPEEEVVYQHHQVHPSIVNHSVPNRTQTHVDDTMSRQSEAMSRASPARINAASAHNTGARQRQYSRGYSRGTSGASYTSGGHSFENPSEAEFSETASSAQYYAQNQGSSRSFMSTGSGGESFDEYGQ